MNDKFTNIAIDDVVAIKLSTVEEIIAKVVEVGADSLTLSRVRVVLPQMISPTELGMQLLPWVVTEPDTNIRLHEDYMLVVVKINNDTAKQYLQNTTSILLS
jgi:hypothetical protein